MADFNFVTARLATGAAINSPADVDALAAGGITAVIDCRDDFDDARLLGARFRYLWNGTADDGLHKPPAWFEKSIQFALSQLELLHQKVYCHCAAGVNRGPSTTYAILRSFGIDASAAEAMIRAARPQVGLAYKADADAAIAALGWG